MMSNSDTEEIYPTESHCLQLVHLMLTIDGVRRHITSPSFISVLNQHGISNSMASNGWDIYVALAVERFQLWWSKFGSDGDVDIGVESLPPLGASSDLPTRHIFATRMISA